MSSWSKSWSFPNDFDVYDRKVTEYSFNDSRVNWKQDYRIYGHSSLYWWFDIPAVRILYFDIASHSYKNNYARNLTNFMWRKDRAAEFRSVVSNFNNGKSLIT